MILGGPGETGETLEETLANSRKLPDVVVLPIIGMRVYPNTPVYRHAVEEGMLLPEVELLEPFHYLARGLTAETINRRLKEHVKSCPNWIVGEPPPSFHELVGRLRQRGVVGPLWTYFAMLQRLPLTPSLREAPDMRKRLLLISPLAPRTLFGADFSFRLPCLSLLRVAALTPADWETKVLDEKVAAVDLEQEADVVGITAMTCTVTRAYEIADRFRARGIPVIMGGMHASSLPEEALGHADSVVVGEAEGLWPKVLQDLENGQLQPIYRHQQAAPGLDRLPPINWDLYRGKGYLPVHFVETTRGCPFDCEFCAVTTFFGGGYRNRPLEEVIDELEKLQPFEGFVMKNMVFFVDDNIVSNRSYARALLTRLAEMGIQWLGHASVNLASDPEILRLCQRSGCLGVLIGFETLSPETMLSIGKKSRLRIEYLDAIQKIHDHGIGVDGSFVFGFDTDDEGVFERTLDFVTRAKIEVPYFSILTPYPGTRLYHRLNGEQRILTRDWSLYDTSHVVIEPKQLTPEQLQEGYLTTFREAFSKTCMAARLNHTTSCRALLCAHEFWVSRRCSAALPGI